MFLLKLALSLAFVAFMAYETRDSVLRFNQPNARVTSFLAAVAFASVGWVWVYLVGELLITGQFAASANSYFGGLVACCIIAGFISVCLASYVLAVRDLPKGPTR